VVRIAVRDDAGPRAIAARTAPRRSVAGTQLAEFSSRVLHENRCTVTPRPTPAQRDGKAMIHNHGKHDPGRTHHDDAPGRKDPERKDKETPRRDPDRPPGQQPRQDPGSGPDRDPELQGH